MRIAQRLFKCFTKSDTLASISFYWLCHDWLQRDEKMQFCHRPKRRWTGSIYLVNRSNYYIGEKWTFLHRVILHGQVSMKGFTGSLVRWEFQGRNYLELTVQPWELVGGKTSNLSRNSVEACEILERKGAAPWSNVQLIRTGLGLELSHRLCSEESTDLTQLCDWFCHTSSLFTGKMPPL